MQCYNHSEKEAAGACVYCGKLFCADCLIDVNGKYYCKADIGNVVNEAKQQTAAATPSITISNVNTNTNNNSMGMAYPQKSKMVALLLCIFLGGLGIHRFYVGKIGTGFIWFLTGGLFVVGWVIDVILIITGAFRDKAGMPLR